MYLDRVPLERLNSGHPLTSCEPRERVERLKEGSVGERLSAVGQQFDVADLHGNIVAKAKLADCFITTFGSPNEKLLGGLGFGSDVSLFRSEYGKFWEGNFPNQKLNDATELFVQVWEPVA